MKNIALVTGCNGGIGKAICEEFIKKDWIVFGIDKISNTKDLGDRFQFIHLDISQPDAIQGVFKRITNEHNRLNALVNNAALQICKPFYQVSDLEWDDLMNINLKVPFQLIREGYELLKLSKGAVVNISSVHAIATSKEIAAYATSKGGLSALTRALSVECAPDGVRVNAIQPGAVDTQMLRDGLKRNADSETDSEDRLIRALGMKHSMGRVGSPQEIAKSAFFLADNEQSSFITGQCITVDGGATIKLSTE